MSTLPPVGLAARVMGTSTAGVEDSVVYEQYDASGRATRQEISRLLTKDFTFPGKRVLDFGCGSGRTLRHFTEEALTAEFWGCDSHQESIAWCLEHLAPPIHFLHNGDSPPLYAPDGSFDLIYAAAVFTHLVDTWSEWLLDLHRLLASGGLLLATFHGRGLWSAGVAGQRGVAFDEDRIGMHVEHYPGSLLDSCGPAVWLSEWWLREHWGRAFEILTLEPTGFGQGADDRSTGQGCVVMRRKDVSLTPEDLRRPSRDPREVEAALHSRDLLLKEFRQVVASLSGHTT